MSRQREKDLQLGPRAGGNLQQGLLREKDVQDSATSSVYSMSTSKERGELEIVRLKRIHLIF